ncbi:hypothetical protein HHK36_005529 [Tetracentron sinense]|uniref:Uncharacterized protein n=1 Tax=Tetracentron sinense TaxID=13715 RepID=A0A835DME2_TETSI|nr:hypothetical protein HHK36_005529 [Tetracentron sinense]
MEHMKKFKQIRNIMGRTEDSLESLIMINALQRLGIDYHFYEEIRAVLSRQYENVCAGGFTSGDDSLYDVALSFRLLRQDGYNVPADVFKNFKDKEGKFILPLSKDIAGMMVLYEASHLAVEGENILDEANDFARQHLNASMMRLFDQDLARILGNTLDNPYHKSLARTIGSNGIVCHGRWWRDLGLAQELKFARDQPLKWYMWPMVTLTDPRFSEQRVEHTKPISLIYIIDDIFDVYGRLVELVLFTEAINRWELAAVDQLPNYMKILEAKRFASDNLPKAEEYLKNAVESVDLVDDIPGLISFPATILRLWDDLESAKVGDSDENQKGYDGSYVDCYMKEHGGCSVESAREHVEGMISDTWKRLNKESLSPNPFSPSFTKGSLNVARVVPVMYSYDHDQNLPLLEEYITSLLHESIAL